MMGNMMGELSRFFREERWAMPVLAALAMHVLLIAGGLGLEHLTDAPARPLEVVISLDTPESRFKDTQTFVPSPPKSEEEVESNEPARYATDRRVRVKKEQQARPSEESEDSDSAPDSLSNFGVPIAKAENESSNSRESRDSRRSRGARANIIDPELPLGSEELLNADEMQYYSFYHRIYEQVLPLWRQRMRQEIRNNDRVYAGTFVTELEMSLDREGYLAGVRILTPSGIYEFDDIARGQIQQAGRFPNPPRELLDKYGQAHIGWRFTVMLESSLIQFERMRRIY